MIASQTTFQRLTPVKLFPQLMNIAVNPRDVAYCFVKYAKRIHAKVNVEDPNFIRLSIACGKVRLFEKESPNLP
jgi:hypothetical protein